MEPIIFNAAGVATGGSGIAEMLLANNFNVGALRPYVQDGKAWMTVNGKAVPAMNNATLLKDEWEMMDTAIIKAFQHKLTYVKSLKAAGLTYSLPDPLKHTVLTHQNMSNAQKAMISMDANVQNQGDTFEVGTDSIPIPIISSGFNLDIRQLAGSRGSQLPLDTTNQEFLARANAEFLENQTIFGNGTITEANKIGLDFSDSAVRLAQRFVHGGNVIDGVFTKDAAVQYTLANNWLAAGTTGKQIVADIRAMKQKMIEQGYSGNLKLTLPSYLETPLDNDYKSSESSSIMSILERARKIEGLTIEFCESMGRITPTTAGQAINVSMVAQQTDVIRIVDGFDSMLVKWDTQGAMNTSYRILTIQVPQLRTRQAGDCGIVNGRFELT